jgi:hypothetical protein
MVAALEVALAHARQLDAPRGAIEQARSHLLLERTDTP